MQEMIELKSELDKLMSSLNGVLAARTVLNEQDEIIEVHILSDLSKSPKQLVRDIQSAIMAAVVRMDPEFVQPHSYVMMNFDRRANDRFR